MTPFHQESHLSKFYPPSGSNPKSHLDEAFSNSPNHKYCSSQNSPSPFMDLSDSTMKTRSRVYYGSLYTCLPMLLDHNLLGMVPYKLVYPSLIPAQSRGLNN